MTNWISYPFGTSLALGPSGILNRVISRIGYTFKDLSSLDYDIEVTNC